VYRKPLSLAIGLAILAMPLSAGVVYKIDFEDNSTTASVGTSKREESAQGSTGVAIVKPPQGRAYPAIRTH
jgi:hypothetical protein